MELRNSVITFFAVLLEAIMVFLLVLTVFVPDFQIGKLITFKGILVVFLVFVVVCVSWAGVVYFWHQKE